MRQDSLVIVAALVAALFVWNMFLAMDNAANTASIRNLELESCAARHSAAVSSLGGTIQSVALSAGEERLTHYAANGFSFYPCSPEAVEGAEIRLMAENNSACASSASQENCFSITLSTSSFSFKKYFLLGKASFEHPSACPDKAGYRGVRVEEFGFGDYLFSNQAGKICVYKAR